MERLQACRKGCRALCREEIDAKHPAFEADGDFASFLAYGARFAGR